MQVAAAALLFYLSTDKRQRRYFSSSGCPGLAICDVTKLRNAWLSMAEVEYSRTHFDVVGLGLESHVLGLGLEASSPRKLTCPRLEDSTNFRLLKVCGVPEKFFGKRFFLENA